MKHGCKVAVVLAFGVALSADAKADIFDFSYTAEDPNNSNLLYTASGLFAAVAEGAGTYDVTGISGLRDGNQILGLTGYAGADQLLYADAPYVDFSGISFYDVTGSYNLYFLNGAFELSSNVNSVGYPQNGTPVTLQVKAVSEPASFAVLGAGLVALGLIRRRRLA